MTCGRVYIWTPCKDEDSGCRLALDTVSLAHLDPPGPTGVRLTGRYVEVVNASEINVPDGENGHFVAQTVGNAEADVNGEYLFDPEIGGGRLDKGDLAKPRQRARYVEASHFGEVNTYYHVTCIADYVDQLLAWLGEKPLPRVCVLVNAHHAATERDGCRDGARGKMSGKWLPFQGGHYRLPTHRVFRISEHAPIWRTGEIHLGPGWRLTHDGWLPRVAGRAYRCNASHNAGIIYHEYGHHITRHTADFRANAFKAPHRQSNRKTATDEAICDYWAATMLGTPHIWCWHRRHDAKWVHPRSLASPATMADFDARANADPHKNGTILAAALWDLRQAIEQEGKTHWTCDCLVLAALLSVERLRDDPYRPSVVQTRRLRNGFPVLAACLLHADVSMFDGSHVPLINKILKRRGIQPCGETLQRLEDRIVPGLRQTLSGTLAVRERVAEIRERDPRAIIPADDEILHPADLNDRLRQLVHNPYDLVAVGDVMSGARARHRIHAYGPDYPFAWVAPVFRRASIVLGNLEGPFARDARRRPRNFSYKVDPKQARVLRRAGFHVMTLANNHLLDCGREGVHETLETLARQEIEAVGAGGNESTAHEPAVFRAGTYRVGVLGYYWNRRTSALGPRPGSARDLPHLVERDLELLRPRVDRIVVTVHWGIPYQRWPLPEDQIKARHFIDCGADIVIGHHPHVLQPVEIYRGRPIFYSIGNFAFGSGNSRAESLLLGIRFADDETKVDLFPIYARNRDPRVNYQPKVMCGDAASRTIHRLASISGESGNMIEFNELYGYLRVAAKVPVLE